MKNTLDPHNKNHIKVITRIILKPRSFKIEVAKVLSVVLIISLTTWGISGANNLFGGDYYNARDHFSILGTVSEITTDEIILENITNTTLSENDDKVNINYLEFIQTQEYAPLVITDINQGDQVIIQGITDGIELFAKRIILMSDSKSEFKIIEETATSTATTTEEITTATSTEEVVEQQDEPTSTTTEEESTSEEEITQEEEPTEPPLTEDENAITE